MYKIKESCKLFVFKYVKTTLDINEVYSLDTWLENKFEIELLELV